MNWKLKAHVLALLSRVPGGRGAYHLLQRIGGTNRLQLDRDLERAFELVDLVHEAGGTIPSSNVLEVGTGWRPLVPYVFALAGANSVVTVDVNPWLTAAYARETWNALGTRLSQIAERCKVNLRQLQERHHDISPDGTSIEDFLSPLGITYLYPADARSTGLQDNTVDYVVSSNVLEHIPRDIQTDIHRESNRILRPGGLAVHRYNPQDHYSTVDSAITFANFLQFSEQEWHWYGGSGLAYHNRLRSRDYREMFEEAGFQFEVCRERVDQRSLAAISDGSLKVHEEFARYTPNELAVDYMWVACRKQAASESETEACEPCLGGAAS
ncbi:MAG: methyltransferase domain-containing protein [Planctomycetaceae bacterium]